MPRKWSPITRGIKYDPVKVVAALKRRADELDKEGMHHEADGLRSTAYAVEQGRYSVRDAAFELLEPIERGDED